MKRTIFVCMLSLALTFSVTADESGSGNNAKPTVTGEGSLQASGTPSGAANGGNPLPSDTKAAPGLNTQPTLGTSTVETTQGKGGSNTPQSSGAPKVDASQVTQGSNTSSEVPKVDPAQGTEGSNTPQSKVNPKDSQSGQAPKGSNTEQASGAPKEMPVPTPNNKDTPANGPTNVIPGDKTKVDNSTQAGTPKTDATPIEIKNKTADEKNKSEDKPDSKTEKVTEAPKTVTVKPEIIQGRTFDGASFVGGIILTLGLIAVGFIGFKYYKARTERNYHTL